MTLAPPSAAPCATTSCSGLVTTKVTGNISASALSALFRTMPRARLLPPIVRPLLALWPVANGPELLNPNGTPSGIAEAFANPPQHVREDFGTTRIDANLTPNDLLFGVYTVDDSDANTPSQNPYSTIYERLREQVVSAQEQHVFSPNLLNTLRVGYSRAAYYFTGQAPDVSAWLDCGQACRRHRDLGKHGIEWRLAGHARGREYRQQQPGCT